MKKLWNDRRKQREGNRWREKKIKGCGHETGRQEKNTRRETRKVKRRRREWSDTSAAAALWFRGCSRRAEIQVAERREDDSAVGNKRNGDTCREDKWRGKTLTGNNGRGKKSATSGKTSQTGEDWESAADLSQKQQKKKKKTGEKTAGGKHRTRYFQEAGDEQRKDGSFYGRVPNLRSWLNLMGTILVKSTRYLITLLQQSAGSEPVPPLEPNREELFFSHGKLAPDQL